MEFYADNRGKKAGVTLAKSSPLLSFETRAVVFDFDGTITLPKNGRTTWEMIWEYLGYDINECAEYHSQFRRNVISHQEWCEITLGKFRAKGFSDTNIEQVVASLDIVDGFAEVVEELSARNIRLDILSGSIRQIIRKSLGDAALEFQQIKANEMHFDAKSGLVSKIVGTTYDFEGKAKYMRQLVTELGCSPMDVLFIGNAGNDSWVSQSGVRTLCVNPTSTDADNAKMWWQSIREMKDMREILPYCT
ncbi:HAD family hydrolase [Roseibium alexandrii]|nr:HAD family hydrolase [Roseibium alexandrii]